MKLHHVTTQHIAQSEQRGALHRFDVRVENTMRRISYDIMVFAANDSDAAHTAAKYIEDNNLVRAERMVTKRRNGC